MVEFRKERLQRRDVKCFVPDMGGQLGGFPREFSSGALQ